MRIKIAELLQRRDELGEIVASTSEVMYFDSGKVVVMYGTIEGFRGSDETPPDLDAEVQLEVYDSEEQARSSLRGVMIAWPSE